MPTAQPWEDIGLTVGVGRGAWAQLGTCAQGAAPAVGMEPAWDQGSWGWIIEGGPPWAVGILGGDGGSPGKF